MQSVLKRPRVDSPLERRQLRERSQLLRHRFDAIAGEAEAVDRAGVESPLGCVEIRPVCREYDVRSLAQQGRRLPERAFDEVVGEQRQRGRGLPRFALELSG